MSGGARRLSIRRRLDASALRWQARLDTTWVDRTLPWLLAALLTIVMLLISLAVQRQLDGGPTLATWTQASWNLEDGRGTVSSLAGGDMVIDQWAFTTWPLLWLGRFVPLAGVLAVAEALCLGLAVVPLWRMAREVARLRLGLTIALVLAFGFAPVLYTVNLTGWSPVVAAVPAIAWAAWFGQRRRWVAYGLCVALALLSRADVGLLLVMFGILGITSGDRRAGSITAGAGMVWTVAFVALTAPHVPTAPMTASEAVLARGEAPLGVLADPLRLVTDLVIQPNVGALVVLVGPLLFLPLVVPRFALPAVPPIWLGLVGEEAVRQAVGPAPGLDRLPATLLLALVPMVLAATVALSRIGQSSVSRIRVDHRVVAAMVLATIAIFVQVAPTSPFNEPWRWGSQDDVDGARMEAVDLLDEIDPGVSVSASPQVTALVAERAHVDEVPVGPPDEGWEPATEAVLYDTTGLGDDGVALWERRDREEALAALVSQDFDVEYRGEGIILLVRPTE
ncbi:hypothetical protein BH24ACT4_BH24ACT4_03460 [soil metagenome]